MARLRGAALAGLILALAPAAPARAQEDLSHAVDRAGNAMHRAIGEALGLPETKPAARKKPKPAATSTAKPATATAAKPPATATKPPEGAKAPAPAPAQPQTRAAVPLPPEPPQPRSAALTPPKPAPAKPAPAAPDIVAPSAAKPNPSKDAAAPNSPMSLPAKPPVPPAFPTSKGAKPAPPPAVASEPEPPPPVASPEPAVTAKPATGPHLALVPLPPPNPDRAPLATPAALPPPAPAAAPAPESEAAPPAGPEIASGCPELAEAGIAVFTVAEAPPSKGACGIERPIRLSGVRMAKGKLVPLQPPALLRCDMALAISRWIREEVDPLVATLGSPLDKVQVAASYDCRPRNRVAGAKMSEHGRGNAMDTYGYKLEDGRTVRIGGTAKEAMPVAFQEKLKASACGRFMTILGPGSDGYHEEHLHVDLQPRRSGASLCRWAVRDMTAPKPQPKPAAKPDSKPDEKDGDADSPAAAAPDKGAAAAPATAQ